jgi:hypothetical protein
MDLGLDPLQEINRAFQQLLGTPDAATIPVPHSSDELMVWFLLGGKDVGKSTFLNGLLGTEGARLSAESVEGTQRFFAYIHASAVRELEERVQPLSIEVQVRPHTSERHRRLCLIDSPDFDSRFERHASQVAQILSAGVTDGAVLLASPEKYKNLQYWNAFQSLSRTLSPRHILFVLTKADELGEFLEAAREDFVHTVSKRMHPRATAEQAPSPPDLAGGIYLIDSLRRGVDFRLLEDRLMRKLSAGDVQSAQHANRRHALAEGAGQVRKHYRLDEIHAGIHSATDPHRIDDLCEDAFPGTYFQTVASRLSENRDIASAIRERLWFRPGSLAGLASLHSVLRGISTRNPFRFPRRSDRLSACEPGPDLLGITRWGNESLEQKLIRCRREALSGLCPEHPDAMEPFVNADLPVLRALPQRLEDLLSLPWDPVLSTPLRSILNLPVRLYALFFLLLLFSPIFLLLKAWGMPHMPDFTGMLALDNVKVAVLGFAGYYLMAALFVLRKHREQGLRELTSLAHRFVLDLRQGLREEVNRPLLLFQEAFSRLEQRLDSAVLLPVPDRGSSDGNAQAPPVP